MRMIGHLPSEVSARRFSDYLYAQGIDNQIELERDGRWALWIHAEDHIASSEGLLEQYRQNPADPKYIGAAKVADERRLREERANEAAGKRFHDAGRLFPGGLGGIGPLTLILVALSVAVALASGFGGNTYPTVWLHISKYDVIGGGIARLKGLPEIRHGELWRLFTPIFLHGGMVHLLVNMLCLLDFGTIIERRQNSRVLAVLVLVIGALSNLGQYLWQGPGFGGMSGVIYGLIGYIWLRGSFDPASGLFLHSSTVTMAVIWFFLCLVGVIPHVANAAHAVGFAVGIAWGYLSALVANRQR